MSKKTNLIVAGVAAVLAAGIGFVLFPSSGDNSEDLVTVYKAKVTISENEAYQDGWFEETKVPKAEDWMVTNLDKIKNLKPIRTIATGRYIDVNDFTSDSPMVFKDNEGEYTIKVKAENVNGGRVEAGNEVHVIFVSDESEVSSIGQIVVHDVRVLSIRTQYARDVEEDKESVPAAVTLKVTEEQAQQLAWYQEHGTLSLFVKGDSE